MSIHFAFLLSSVVLDVLANLALAISNGFKKKAWGVAAIVLIMAAFALLAIAVQGMPLFVAYTAWGVLSIAGTALATWWFLDQPMNRTIVFGIMLLILAILLMQVDG
ncbi:MAG: multidrug transporter subunit MdtI [Alcaligenaceae bacterium]|nr:multidrug transporter subunit MdtI [Alcaligenaceae bacterium]